MLPSMACHTEKLSEGKRSTEATTLARARPTLSDTRSLVVGRVAELALVGRVAGSVVCIPPTWDGWPLVGGFGGGGEPV